MNPVSRKNNLWWNYSRIPQKLDIFILSCTPSVFPDIQNAFFSIIFLNMLGHYASERGVWGFRRLIINYLHN